MQQRRRRVKRQRNEEPKPAWMPCENSENASEPPLVCNESAFGLCDSPPQHSHVDRQASDASTSTMAPILPATSPSSCVVNPSLWNYCHQVYIANSHCPVDGWYQACRVCNSWTAAELMVGTKAVPLCKGCQLKCHKAYAKGGGGPSQHSTAAATATALLSLDRAWDDYLNKLRMDNGMAFR